MVHTRYNQNCNSKLSIIVCLLIVLFSICNVFNSALFGHYIANRTFVYYLISAIIGVELFYLVLSSIRCLKINSFSIIVSIILFYVLILDFFRGIGSWQVLIHCGTLFFWICTYVFIDRIVSRNHRTITIFHLLIVVLFYVFAGLSVLAQRDIADIRGQDVAVVNLSYYCLACFPLAMLEKNKKTSIIIAVITSVYSLKRGAIVTIVLMLLLYYYTDGKINRKGFSICTKVLMVGLFFFISYHIVDYYTAGFLSVRFTRDSLLDGSGRSHIVNTSLYYFRNRSFGLRMFGTGSGTSSATVGITLHNDYLDFLYCFGYLGLLLYVIFILSLIRKLSILVKLKSSYAPYFAMICAFMFGLSIFEGAILNFAFLYPVIQFSTIEKMYLFDEYNHEVKDAL